MDYFYNIPLTLDLVQLNQKYHGGLGNKGSSHLIQHNFFICPWKQGKEENHMGTKPLLKNGHGDKNMKVNENHHHASLTSRSDLK